MVNYLRIFLIPFFYMIPSIAFTQEFSLPGDPWTYEKQLGQYVHPFEKICRAKHKSVEIAQIVQRLHGHYHIAGYNCQLLVKKIWEEEKIDLSGEFAFENLSLLKGFTNTKFLNLSMTKVSDISQISFLFPKLKYLIFGPPEDGAILTNIEPLAGLKHLRTLVLDGQTKISDFSVISQLKKLRYLNLVDTNISSLHFLPKGKLEVLNISGTKVRDLSPLCRLRYLNDLAIWGTGLTKDHVPIHVHDLHVEGYPINSNWQG